MERRELWAWLGGGAIALGGIGLGVVGLMAEAQPLAYWTTIAVLAACFIFGAVVLYLLNRHRFFGASVGPGLWVMEEEVLAPDRTGMPGWRVRLVVTREAPPYVRIVADEVIYDVRASYVQHHGDPVGATGIRSPRPNVAVAAWFGPASLEGEELIGDLGAIRQPAQGHKRALDRRAGRLGGDSLSPPPPPFHQIAHRPGPPDDPSRHRRRHPNAAVPAHEVVVADPQRQRGAVVPVAAAERDG
jgi:hypothetical protein